MAAPYSYDLRQKVIQAIDNGMRKSEALFVCLPLVVILPFLWLKRRETTGEFQAHMGYQKGSRHKITNWDSFREFAQAHGELTTAEMAEVWSEKVSRHTISRGLKKINFTRKKRHMAIKKEMNNGATHSDLTSNKKTQKP
jgi:transposase